MLGRGMADDGRSAHPTVTTAETGGRRCGPECDRMRSGDGPYGTRSGDRRYRTHRTIRDAVPGDGHHRTRWPCPATSHTARDDHPRRRARRRALRHATIISYPMMSG